MQSSRLGAVSSLQPHGTTRHDTLHTRRAGPRRSAHPRSLRQLRRTGSAWRGWAACGGAAVGNRHGSLLAASTCLSIQPFLGSVRRYLHTQTTPCPPASELRRPQRSISPTAALVSCNAGTDMRYHRAGECSGRRRHAAKYLTLSLTSDSPLIPHHRPASAAPVGTTERRTDIADVRSAGSSRGARPRQRRRWWCLVVDESVATGSVAVSAPVSVLDAVRRCPVRADMHRCVGVRAVCSPGPQKTLQRAGWTNVCMCGVAADGQPEAYRGNVCIYIRCATRPAEYSTLHTYNSLRTGVCGHHLLSIAESQDANPASPSRPRFTRKKKENMGDMLAKRLVAEDRFQFLGRCASVSHAIGIQQLVSISRTPLCDLHSPPQRLPKKRKKKNIPDHTPTAHCCPPDSCWATWGSRCLFFCRPLSAPPTPGWCLANPHP